MNEIDDMKNKTGNDSATLEREINETRAEMDRTLDALERKLSPGQLLDQAMGFAREHGGDFASNLGQSVKENPMPALLTAVGVAWMLASSNRPKPSMCDLDDRVESQRVTSTGSETGNQPRLLRRAGEQAKASAEGMRAGAAEQVRSVVAGARQTLSSSRGTLEDQIRRTSDTAQVQAQRFRESFTKIFEEQPFLVGALGIAVGAAIGAVLPATEKEDRLFGEVRDQTLSEVKERGAEAYNQVKESVTRVGEEAKQAISQSN